MSPAALAASLSLSNNRTIALPSLRLVHLSDIHIWKFTFSPARLANKRLFGVAALMANRARKFRLEHLAGVVERVLELRPDHVLITGDLTTTSLPAEFQEAREALAPLLTDPGRATIIPGNHDRYTGGAVRDRLFEQTFGPFAGAGEYPWLRRLGESTAILALDPTRAALTARGLLPENQLTAARSLWQSEKDAIHRLIVACHYPLDAPAAFRDELHPKRMLNAGAVAGWLATVGPHLYCCGHVHRAWAFTPPSVPNQLCLNAGAPLLRDRSGTNPPGFLEIVLDESDVAAIHHYWDDEAWRSRELATARGFFRNEADVDRESAQWLQSNS